MNWRYPDDNFGTLLASAYSAVLENANDPWLAVEPFEPIFEELKPRSTTQEYQLSRVRSLGQELYEELRSSDAPVAMEVRHYCWYLHHLERSSIKDVRVLTFSKFKMFASHRPEWCSICKEFPNDMPHRPNPEAWVYFRKWLDKKNG